MALRVESVESTELFVGSESAPLQVVRVVVAGFAGEVLVEITGAAFDAVAPVTAVVSGPTTVEVGVSTPDARAGAALRAVVVVRGGGERDSREFELAVAEPGWTMHMVSHFHYDPVWWNTQSAYTDAWDAQDFPGSPRGANQLAGFDLVRAHLDLALREPEYKFVLAEVDYLKPYWDVYPQDREVLRRLVEQGRVELMGGTYNEPNTNLTSPETTIRNFVHGIGFQRHVVGADPQTAWQLDAFGHDPAFPGFAADAGLTSSSWARGPYHQWGPMQDIDGIKHPDRMQFPSEFEWISPSGRGLFTSYMADHYSAGWWMDSSASLEDAMAATHRLFLGLKRISTTRQVLLPVGTDYTPPNKWVTRIHREWSRRYVWPRFHCALPREFFAAVRAELDERGEQAMPQSRDMNPIYTGKDVSYIDTKQAQREAENLLLEAERFAVFAGLLTGVRYPDAAFAKAWVQLVYGAHHDAITGSEGDQVYLDLLSGWREARELAVGARDAALRVLTSTVDTSLGAASGGTGANFIHAVSCAVVVWNSFTHERTDLVTVRLDAPVSVPVVVLDDEGALLPALVSHAGTSLTFLAAEVPSLGWRSYRIWSSDTAAQPVDNPVDYVGKPVDSADWEVAGSGLSISNEHYRLTVDPERGGCVSSLVASGRELVTPGRVANELALYDEYSQHPDFGEGPWHLLPKGAAAGSAARPADRVELLRCPIGERLVVRGSLGPVRYRQTITLWRGIDRVDCSTKVEEFTGSDHLLRVRWPLRVPGALPVSEVGDAVIGRGFGLVDVDSGKHPWTLDNPAYTWFGLSCTAAVRISCATAATVRAIGVAELVVPQRRDAAPLARDLTVALARSGVTTTCGTADGPRYGNLDVDSNLPDVRIALGGPDSNAFTDQVLDRADPAYRAELARQLAESGRARVWVPAGRPLAEVWVPGADLRDTMALPVLVVAGATEAGLHAEIASIVDELDTHEIQVRQQVPVPVDEFESRTVALVNRGVPGFAVDSAGTLHASLLRSCTGWPSGTWITPPRRTVPDGSNFQLQHWTHVFDYAVVAGDGSWREAGVGRSSAEFNRPLIAVVAEPGAGAQPVLGSSGSLLRVEPAGAVTVGAFKAAGNPLVRGSAEAADPASSVALRLVETRGEATVAKVSSPLLRLADPARANLLEQRGVELPVSGPADELVVALHGFEVATLVAKPELTIDPAVSTVESLGPEAEPAQPLYARYWMHNRGPAPLGGLPAAVHVDPVSAYVEPGRSVRVRVSAASDRTDGDLHGRVRLVLPDGWAAQPAELVFGLPPSGHSAVEVTLTAPPGAAPGLYPVRAQLELVGDGLPPSWGQVVEDVVVLTVPEDEPGGLLGLGVLDLGLGVLDWGDASPSELLRLADGPAAVRVAVGERARLAVEVHTLAAMPFAVEAQLLSPWGTWEWTPDWCQGAELPAHGRHEFGFELTPPRWADPGQYWALVRVAGAGRLLYSPAVSVEVTA